MRYSSSNRLPSFLFRSALMGFCLLASPVATTTTDSEPSDPCDRRGWSFPGWLPGLQCGANNLFGTNLGVRPLPPSESGDVASPVTVETPDPAPTVATVARAESTVARAESRVARAESTVARAESRVARAESRVATTPEREESSEEPASDANQSLLGEPPGAFTRGVYRDEDGNARTVNGDLIKDMLGSPLPYSEGLKVVQDDAGNILSVEDEEKGVCYPAPGGNNSLGDLMGLMGDTPEDSGSETTPSRIQQAREAAEAGEPLPLTNPTTAEIEAYNSSLPIPYRPVSTDCASDFIGPPVRLGADCSRIAGREDSAPETSTEETAAPEQKEAVDTAPIETGEVVVVSASEPSGTSTEEAPVPAPRPSGASDEENARRSGETSVVTAPEVPEDDAKTEQENEGAMEIPSTEPVSPDEFDGSNQDALDEFLNREGQGTEVSPEPETVANSRASGIQGGWQGTEVSPEPETVEPEEEEASPSNSRMNVGDEPESDENTVAEPESGNGFWNEGTSAVTEDEIREEEDQQDSIASPEVDTNEDFNNDFFNDLMDEAETESDIVEIPERNRPSSGLRSGENEEEGQETPAEFRPLPPLSSAELDETIRVANLEIEDGEAAVQDSLLNRRVMRTADGQQVVGIAVVENEGGEAPVQNSRQTYLDKGISEEKLDECEQMYGPGNYETCLKENLANFVEGMMVESTGGLNIQPE